MVIFVIYHQKHGVVFLYLQSVSCGYTNGLQQAAIFAQIRLGIKHWADKGTFESRKRPCRSRRRHPDQLQPRWLCLLPTHRGISKTAAGDLLGVVQFGGPAGFFSEHVVDISAGLFERGVIVMDRQ